MKKLSDETIQKIKDLRVNSGMKYSDIAKTLGIGNSAVSKYCTKFKIRNKDLGKPTFKIPDASVAIPLSSVECSNRIDKEYASTLFERIDTEEKAYWLGFMYADGCVSLASNTISLSQKEDDLEHLKRFRSFLHLDGKKIRERIKTIGEKSYVGYSFDFTNKKIKTDLIKLGCVPQKTFLLAFPSDDIVPSNLMRHFVRGYYDGDGACTHGGKTGSKMSLEILGTKEFLLGYQKWTGIDHKLYHFNHSKISRSIYGAPYAIYVLDRLYDNATIYLKRKYDTYLKERRLALQSIRTARLLVDKIGEGLAGSADANTEVTSAA